MSKTPFNPSNISVLTKCAFTLSFLALRPATLSASADISAKVTSAPVFLAIVSPTHPLPQQRSSTLSPLSRTFSACSVKSSVSGRGISTFSSTSNSYSKNCAEPSTYCRGLPSATCFNILSALRRVPKLIVTRESVSALRLTLSSEHRIQSQSACKPFSSTNWRFSARKSVTGTGGGASFMPARTNTFLKNRRKLQASATMPAAIISTTEIIITKTTKLVPHRSWCLLELCTFSTVSSFSASKQLIVLCSAP